MEKQSKKRIDKLSVFNVEERTTGIFDIFSFKKEGPETRIYYGCRSISITNSTTFDQIGNYVCSFPGPFRTLTLKRVSLRNTSERERRGSSTLFWDEKWITPGRHQIIVTPTVGTKPVLRVNQERLYDDAYYPILRKIKSLESSESGTSLATLPQEMRFEIIKKLEPEGGPPSPEVAAIPELLESSICFDTPTSKWVTQNGEYDEIILLWE